MTLLNPTQFHPAAAAALRALQLAHPAMSPQDIVEAALIVCEQLQRRDPAARGLLGVIHHLAAALNSALEQLARRPAPSPGRPRKS